jgi:methyl-accepting chemotaxis protein
VWEVNLLQGMTMRARLLWAFGVVIALTCALGGMAIMQLGKVQDSVIEIGESWLPSVSVTGALRASASDYRRSQLAHVLATETVDMDRLEGEMRGTLARMDKARKEYEPLLTTAEEKRVYEAFAGQWATYVAGSDAIISLSHAQKTEEARRALQGEYRRTFDAIAAATEKLVAENEAGAKLAREHAQATYAASRNLTFAILATAALAGLAMALLITRSLMRDLGGEPAYARDMLRRVAAGELDVRIAVASADETSLMAELKRMVARLNQMILSIRAASDSIGTASSQIAAGNTDLSSRTEEQASNLQQTAASMEQFTSSVKANADAARQAATLAAGAADVAAKSGTLVGDVVQTMSKIQDSSRRIADIITVIDGIAFQTNILALNAAVEAARAGEQGRGFAVVAAEVRALAQRAGQAAREIKTLISDSTEKVDAGGRQVQAAGTTIDDLVQQVRRVSEIISEITAATLEQSTGINQVNEAVTQLDQVTQQNAALVEESAAATESLRAQAGGLAQQVSVFRTAASGGFALAA